MSAAINPLDVSPAFALPCSGFIEFEDVAAAMAVHDSLQGAILASSDRGGIRVQYSKAS